MNIRKRFWIFAATVGIVLVAVWIGCFLRINRAYPQAELIRVGLNEPLQYGLYTVTVSEAHIEDTSALYEKYELSADYKTLPEKTLMCTVNIRRTKPDLKDSSQHSLNLSYITAVSGAWRNMADLSELFESLNSGVVTPSRLQQGEQQSYTLAFGLWKDSFSPTHWERLDEIPFAIQLSIYPQKNEISLGALK